MLAGLRTASRLIVGQRGRFAPTAVAALNCTPTPSTVRTFAAQSAAAQEENIPILKTTKPSPKLGNLQQECWDTYLSTGRGCLTLFSLIDTDHSNSISYSEIKFWMENGEWPTDGILRAFASSSAFFPHSYQ